MTSEQQSGRSWRDDLTDLIRRKQEENELLRKVKQSFQPEYDAGDNGKTTGKNEDEIEVFSDADEFAFYSDEDQPIINENNQQ